MNKEWYEKEIKDRQEAASGTGGVTEFVNSKDVQTSRDFDDYERLCRGEQTRVRTRRVR